MSEARAGRGVREVAIGVHENPCLFTQDRYGHYCVLDADHQSQHQCVCGERHRALWLAPMEEPDQ